MRIFSRKQLLEGWTPLANPPGRLPKRLLLEAAEERVRDGSSADRDLRAVQSSCAVTRCTRWAMPGMLSPCWEEVGDIRAPVAINSTLFHSFFSIFRRI